VSLTAAAEDSARPRYCLPCARGPKILKKALGVTPVEPQPTLLSPVRNRGVRL
jgi:hypothetical protein